MKKLLWIGLGWISVALGVVGAFLPLLPTTPFLLLAAFAFSQGSEKLHLWITTHPQLGPPIVNWQKHGAIERKVKYYAVGSMLGVVLLTVLIGAPYWALGAQIGVLLCVAGFIISRPEPKN